MKGAALSAIIFAWTPIFAGAQPTLETAMQEAHSMITAAKDARRNTARPPKKPKDVIIPHFQQKNFPTPTNGTCGLKSFTVMDYEHRWENGPQERSRLSIMGAVIETTSPDCIRDYGIVQFIQGCVYGARYDVRTGALLDKTFDIGRELRGAHVLFTHPTYEVDQTEMDPLFTSYPGETSRLALAYVPKTPLKLHPDTPSMLADFKAFDMAEQRMFLKDYRGPTSVTFVTDIPTGGLAYFDEYNLQISATNSSLDFKTCVYRIKDVPVSGDPAGEGTPPDDGGPLQCFSWASRYTYDAATHDFAMDRFKGLDPFCAQAPARYP